MSEILRKLTIKAIGCKPDFNKLLETEGKKMKLAKIYGIARKAKPDSSEYGNFVRFTGSFRAVNLDTGEIYESGAMILPGVAQDLLAAALDNDSVTDVQFGFEIGIAYAPDVVTKYVYTVESMIKPAENDPMLMLEKQLAAQAAPALAAPAAENAPAPDAGAAPESAKKPGKK